MRRGFFTRRSLILLVLTAPGFVLIVGPAPAGSTPDQPPSPRTTDVSPTCPGEGAGYSPGQLSCMGWDELDALYRRAPAACIAPGFTPGRAIYEPGKPLTGVKTALTGWGWQGKVFEEDATLVNQWRGARAIRARVFPGESWLDGGPALIMDYADTSVVWRRVRDEVREVSPGVYLGVMFVRSRSGCPCDARRKMFFVLSACPADCPRP